MSFRVLTEDQMDQRLRTARAKQIPICRGLDHVSLIPSIASLHLQLMRPRTIILRQSGNGLIVESWLQGCGNKTSAKTAHCYRKCLSVSQAH